MGSKYQCPSFVFNIFTPMASKRVSFKKDGKIMNGKPVYRKLGNENMFLAYSNVLNNHYPVPWTMWGGPNRQPGDHVGNIKIGPKNLSCPENFSVQHLKCLASPVNKIMCFLTLQVLYFYSNYIPFGSLLEANLSKITLKCGSFVDHISSSKRYDL